ncbi:MAG: MgtC/SapB transporter [Anaerosporomusa subterranea]|jgi:putative Mg2+ transporter-C (MgtC) family protein|nr:MgtC/SapB transporter [Anaerosporomusa subterranea]
MIDDATIIIRLVTSVLLGGIIGFEREHSGKPAGLKTHILVSLGSCLVAILSVNLYAGVQGLTNADPARLAAQVVSGIGFLGAGAIIKEGPTIRGLTTAASLWVVASVGLAAGVGMMVGAMATAILVVIVLQWLPKLEKWLHHRSSEILLYIHTDDRPGQVGRIGSRLGTLGIRIIQIKIEEQENGGIGIPIILDMKNCRDLTTVIAELSKVEGVISVTQEFD